MIAKGQKINDRYEIIRSIGEGGMANVYLGYDTILDRNVAIKVLRGDLSNDEKFVRRFQREALSASSLAHPNIVEVYDVGEDNGLYYIVMEYIEGKTLKQLLKKRGTLTLSEAIDIMLQLTDGMAHAHDSYIIHRDLKPQNIMIKDDGQIKITDFGIAMALNSTQLTQTNSVMGSVHYLPPEQASGKGCTIKSDIYSMGIIFYELLSGSLPFRGDNAVEIALKHMRDPLPSLREENPAIPQSIENIIRKATAKNPKNRYEDARSMHEDLLTALDDDRMDEPVYQYKYPEHETDNTKRIKKLENIEDKKEAEEDKTDEVAKKIDEEDLEEKKSNRVIIILAIVFGVLALALITVFFIVPAFSNEKPVTIPECEGEKVSTCEKKLQALGLEVNTKIKTESSSEIDKNRVTRTDPEEGRSVKPGTVVTIYKSTGEEVYEIEDYTGKNYIEVQTILERNYGLNVTVEKKEPTDSDKEYDEQEIIGQSLAAGSEVKKGDSIILYIPDIVDKFPDMNAEGWSIEDVEAFCDKYNLVLEKKYQASTKDAPGKIIDQSRAPGSPIYEGRTLTVTIATEPEPASNTTTDKDNDKTDSNS
ncbi:MAG: Stk1 family PASTA domain-containing Ser/Thr kinase [Bacilli bacterium]|nr:Stk1 family PASTA domain-containing Ser/Thr kinase [Mycoplasmatota bacterium]MDD6941524.1 Stk1 family PASTA domain-containing Ser/Thr kinase [bacterium]MDY2697133.1 Stk1 family PASTA domain-containing Ser/Thr kinase [Bacilli bacterium]MDY5993139.1 Stk1 family PASTA domain-containing Ser/Thr kinase [Bacilli bacterium]MEE0014473.1 Stk1 family PASTA domain-containing Ser/Thr kinase [Bacilli bacterium]